MKKLGFPGQFICSWNTLNLYRGKLWTMRQFPGFGTPENTNNRFKKLMKKGHEVYRGI